MSLVAYKYTPSEMSERELDATFAARGHTVDYLLKSLRDQVHSGTLSSFVVTGPRGAGKSTVIRMVAPHLIALQFGASEDQLIKASESMLELTQGWDRKQVAEIVRETLIDTIEPLIYAEALELSMKLQTLNRYLEYDPGYVAPAKEALNLMGLPGGFLRAPLPQLTSEEKAGVKAALKSIGVL